ncbi:tryptophanyl-tRNA synthetase [Xylaria digitata]|nr:tryptophanyl-tRNA synthetase [Xylaria digitata]
MAAPKIPVNSVSNSVAQEQNITPWDVSGEIGQDGKVKPINYDKLVDQFGTKLIDDALLQRFEHVTGHKPHRLLRRGIVFSHRDLEVILDRYEKKDPFFIYTGRGPSSDVMHIGHMVPFELTKWLSDVFEVPLVVMLTDDEKYLISSMDRSTEEYKRFARENAKDIIAVGFNPERTFIFSDFDFMGGEFYRNVVQIAKRISRGTADASFGFDSTTNIGKVHFTAIQALKYAKPPLIHARFLDGLQGPGSKMSASVESTAIYLSDSPKQTSKKINQRAFSGGQETVQEHRAKGGNPEVDISYRYLTFFLEDDEELQRIEQDYRSGKMLTGEIKKICADELTKFCVSFQERRAKVTDEILDQFMTPRPLICRGVRSDTILAATEITIVLKDSSDAKDPGSKNQAKKLEKLRLIEAKKVNKHGGKEDKVED